MTYSNRAALISILLFLPFFTLNFVVGRDIAAVDHFFRAVFSLDGFRINPLGHIVFLAAVLLLPVGSVVALRPVFRQSAAEKRPIYIVNIVIGAILLLAFVLIAGALSAEVYRCDVLLIPNCD